MTGAAPGPCYRGQRPELVMGQPFYRGRAHPPGQGRGSRIFWGLSRIGSVTYTTWGESTMRYCPPEAWLAWWRRRAG